MQEGLRSEIRRLIFLAGVLLVIGLANGYLAETFVVGGLCYTVFTLDKIRRLYNWLASGKDDEMPPEMSGVWGDISDELYRYKQRLERSKKNHTALALRIRQITAALDDGMILLDTDRTLDWWNPSASRMLNLREEDRGEVITNLIRDPGFVDFMHREHFDRSLEIHSPRDPNLIYQVSAGRFGRGEVVLMIRDITRLRHLEEMRKEFVANISHELRTPLTVLVGYLETLQADSDNLPVQWRKALSQMDQQTHRLNSLANDLVMLSRLESTTPSATGHNVDLCRLLGGIVDGARVISDSHRLTLDCEPGLALAGESKELHSAFSNLVFNAVKHNPDGCDVEVTAARDGDDIVVTVTDTGTGIDEAHLPRLTERFYRVDDSRASSSGGTGLGLAIVKHVLNRHNGTLRVTSTLGRGSTFSCRFCPKPPAESARSDT